MSVAVFASALTPQGPRGGKPHSKPPSGARGGGLSTIVHEVLREPGAPLDHDTRAFMESAFHQEFSGVRVHTGPLADQSARAAHATAYTVGRDIVFAEGRYAPWGPSGRGLLAHELAHTVQQGGSHSSTPVLAVRSDPALELAAKRSADAVMERDPSGHDCASSSGAFSLQQLKPALPSLAIQRQEATGDEPDAWPPWWWFGTSREGSRGGGGDFGGGGASGTWDAPHPCGHGCHDWLDHPKPGTYPVPPVPPLRPPSPPAPQAADLHFYHGTRWSVAKQIPGNVKPIGGGDFSAGFYTHYDRDDPKALRRATQWGRRMARTPPKEPFAGVVQFDVVQSDYQQLLANRKGKVFPLYRTDQSDYAQRQKEWLDFVTSTGREATPRYRLRGSGGEWVHERRSPQPSLPYNIIRGPFYRPVPGTRGRQPSPAEFTPYAEGATLPEQVVWANDGIALLNSKKVRTTLMQFDASTGRRQDPPVEVSVAPLTEAEVGELAEAAQMGMTE